MFNWIKNIWPKPVEGPPSQEMGWDRQLWTQVDLADIGFVMYADRLDEYFDFFNELAIFCRDLEIDTYYEVRKPCGYFTMVTGYRFKNDEDAMAFKLRFGE